MPLFCGPAVIIDDNIADGNTDDINTLIAEIERLSIPCAKYLSLPDADELAKHLEGVSFLILDWELKPAEVAGAPGVKMPDTWSDQNIDFLQKIMGKVFLPIFIFTSAEIDEIKTKLTDAGIYDPTGNTLIFIQNKRALLGGALFTQMEQWTRNTSAVYVLKEWEREYKTAKNGLFIDFYGLSHAWPKILWKTYTEDGNPNLSLGDMITRNLYTRMSPFQFDEATINGSAAPDPDMAQLRRVFEGERFLTNLADEDRAPGDLFTNNDPNTMEESPYLLNIRNVCDTSRGRNPDLYLIRGKELETTDRDLFSLGHFNEQHNFAIIPCIHGGKVIQFNFRNLTLEKWNRIKERRIGRVLPPFITRVQQKYALYSQREGVSPITAETYFAPLGIAVDTGAATVDATPETVVNTEPQELPVTDIPGRPADG